MTTLLPLAIRDVTVSRRGKRLLGPVSLDLAGEGLTAVIGPNGAGKTTLLKLMHGLERARGGTLDWAVPQDEARKRQAFVFQTPIMMRRSVLDCIAYPLRLTGAPRAEARAKAAAAARAAGLGDILDVPAHMASGGEKQKLALARALIRDPEVLFLDEPCANLDGRATREFEEMLRRAQAGGVRIVMSTHDMGQARRLADEVIFLARGELLDQRAAAAFFADPQTPEARAYLDGGIVE